MSAKAILSASVSASPAVYVEDVFSTFLYTGNGGSQTITNGIDLVGEGGLTWIKQRSGTLGHRFTDTPRGATKSLESNSTAAEATESTGLTSFSSTGFVIGADTDYNTNADTYCSWTFRKEPKFFDVVTFTCNAGPQTINHNLGSTPGMMIVKNTTLSGDWYVWHRSIPNNALALNTNQSISTFNSPEYVFGNGSTVVQPTSTQFTFYAPASGSNTYVAYLFAHDAGGFGTAGTDNVVSCGSYTGNGSTSGPTVTLGYEPQWLMIKRSDSAGYSWVIFDNMRGLVVGGNDPTLIPNLTNSEGTLTDVLSPLATGFQLTTTNATYNASGGTYIYIAIRRGPMKTPTVGTEVFAMDTLGGTLPNPPGFNSGFPVDMGWFVDRSSPGVTACTRLQGQQDLYTFLTNGEGASANRKFDYNDGWLDSGSVVSAFLSWMFRRAPGFFDVVAYTGTGSGFAISHNLTVVPTLILYKARSNSSNWFGTLIINPAGGVNSAITGFSLNSASSAFNFNASSFGGGGFTATTIPSTGAYDFTGNNLPFDSGVTYVAYLFATLAGVSKVGTYTGTGTGYTVDVNCGFTTGARFVLIKRSDSTGDWFVWDTARGIISGNDPYLLLNSSAAEVTNTDYIDPLSTGFQISSTAPAAINASGGNFIFLAIA